MRERQNKIRESCEQCGSSEKPLVIQHFWHPRSFGKIFRDLAGDDWINFKSSYNEKLAEHLKIEDDVCPRCGSANIRYQKMLGDWRCQTCQDKFKTPIRGMVLDREGRRILSAKKRDSYECRWRQFQNEYGPKYGKAAVLTAIGETRRYLSLENTATFCKRCAFLWDERGLRLCVRCGDAFHSVATPACRTCIMAMAGSIART